MGVVTRSRANFYYVCLCYPPLFETLFAMVLVFKTQFGLVGDRAQFQQKHGDGVMEKNNVLTGLCLQCRQSRPVHDNVLEPSMCDVVRRSLLTLGISQRSLLEVAPRPFASLIVQLGHRFFFHSDVQMNSLPQIPGWARGCIGQAKLRAIR